MAAPHYTDKVWIDNERKMDGIRREIAEAHANGENVVVIAHFEATLAAVAAGLRVRGVDPRAATPGSDPGWCSGNTSNPPRDVWIASAVHFLAGSFPGGSGEGGRLRVVVAEHHPMASHDQALTESLAALPCTGSVVVHTALSDALMKHFGSDRILSLMRSLGADDDCISHPLVSGAIGNAQEKIDRKVRLETDADSAEEWFRLNLPGGR